MDRSQIDRDHEEFLFPCVTQYYDEPLVLTRGRGCWVDDIEGRTYLDFFGGILAVSLGHCQPEVVQAVQEQVAELGHVSTLYRTAQLPQVAKRLASMTPGRLKQSFFVNSGTEANETAVMMARVYTERQEIIVLRHGYAGRSSLAMDLTGQSSWRPLPPSNPGIRFAHAGYCYRCPFHATYPQCDVACAHDLKELIETETNGQPAAFMAEPMQGIGGFITPPPEYFEIAVGIVRSYGGVFICDEVQTGFGRAGEHWFGIEHYGVEPDMMSFAKGIANGFPVGAVIATEEIASSLKGLSISTFGGNPIHMAAADATLTTMMKHDIPRRSSRLGQVLRERLDACADRCVYIGDVRGRGLMHALEMVEDRVTKAPAPQKTTELLERCRAEGLLVGKGGRYGNIIRIAPPMLIDEDTLIDGCDRLTRALDGL